ncbi:hypothetical protein N7520_010603 [Penicillium odoratum]|uniref:uncharacterized protein n=1 Tax=Penicillium odoratum TaxID=1167516 RepID=UPI0025489586|nr:uncharacterized protein N7520_010603 [Penicillium odoratum]KAJ5745421.1 hypothetical protein N7520_010603 [Penicillium odoratum]
MIYPSTLPSVAVSALAINEVESMLHLKFTTKNDELKFLYTATVGCYGWAVAGNSFTGDTSYDDRICA